MTSRYYNFIAVSLIIIVGFAAYFNSFHGAFVFDDYPNIVQNAAIKNIKNIYPIWNVYPFRLITNLSYAVNYFVSGLNVTNYHLFNFIIHLTNALLVFFFVKKTIYIKKLLLPDDKFTRKIFPIAVALFFVSHPIQTQAVSYITQRAATLATLFSLLSFICFLEYANTRINTLNKKGLIDGKYIAYIGMLFFEICALFTKEITYALPFLILLFDVIFYNHQSISYKKRIFCFLPVFIIPLFTYLFQYYSYNHSSSIYAFVQFITHRPIPINPQDFKASYVQYLLTQLNVVREYIRLLVLPYNQNLDYDFPITRTLFNIQTLISLFLLISLLFIAVRLKRKNRLISFGIILFFISLVVEVILPLNDIINEHRLYLPSIGYFIIVNVLLVKILTSIGIHIGTKLYKVNIIIFISITVLSYTILTYKRNNVWRGGYTLWSDAVKKSPDKARTHYNLGIAYHFQGKSDLAIAEYNRALEIIPEYVDANYDLGLEYKITGKLDLAQKAFSKVLESNPKNDLALKNLVDVLIEDKKLDESISLYKKYSNLDLSNKATEYNLRGTFLYKMGQFSDAEIYFKETLRISPEFTDAYYNLGAVYLITGDIENAKLIYKKALVFNSKNVAALIDLGTIFLSQNNPGQAMEYFQKAKYIDPNNPFIYYYLGIAYEALDKLNLSVNSLKTAIILKPDFTPVYNALGSVYNKLGMDDLALEQFRKVLIFDPENILAKDYLLKLQDRNLFINNQVVQ